MNRTLLTALVSALCLLCSHSQVSAQNKGKKPRTPPVVTAEKAPAAGTTRVAVINLGYVLGKYERASAIKEEMQTELNKIREEAKKHTENLTLWQTALQTNNLKDATKEQYEEKIIKTKRYLEDLNRQVQAKFGKSQQTQLVTLWNDIHEGVKAYTAANGIDLVLAYGEPLDKKDVMSYMNIERKMRGADQGGLVPFFAGPGVDISDSVVELLNRRYRNERAVDAEPSENK